MTILQLYFYYSNLRPNNIKSFLKKIVYTCDDVKKRISNKNNDHLEQFIYYPSLDLRNGTLIKDKSQFWQFSLAYSIKIIIFINFMYKDDPCYFLINNNMKNKKIDFFQYLCWYLNFFDNCVLQKAISFWKKGSKYYSVIFFLKVIL